MATTLPVSTQVSGRVSMVAEARSAAQTASVPWTIWGVVAAVTSVMVGGYWDICWHMSIGRDSFWTPAHMAIYFCGVLAGISCGYLILNTTFSGDTAASVQVLGFRAPLGAFIAVWGGIVMLTSAAFDNWWHSAYGLDVKIFSPPHLVLDIGVLAVQVGGMVLIAGAMNRADGPLGGKLNALFLYLGAMIISLGLTVVWEYTYRIFLHSARSYRALSVVAPVLLVGVARASGRRWACTIIAAVYMGYAMAMLWIFPLFPAVPKLGPVYQQVTHFVPMEFPLLLIVPAFLLDSLWAKMPASNNWNKWLQALLAGAVFLVTFVAVEWPFAGFLMSPASRNWFFGTHYFPYFSKPTSYGVRNLFYPWEKDRLEFWMGMSEAMAIAILSTRLGLAWGDWMRRIRR